MTKKIHSIKINPPIAIARLGSSSTSVDAYQWTRPGNPRWDGETAIQPDWTLKIAPDGSVRPELPTEIVFRDGDAIRPVSPFFEIWVLTGEENDLPEAWISERLTLALLREYVDDRFRDNPLAALTLTVSAVNRKAARRAGNPLLEFGTFPNVSTKFDNFSRIKLRGTSPPNSPTPLIPKDREIPLGFVQVVRPRVQLETEAWSNYVKVDTIRFRFTPAQGLSYGPPQAALPRALPAPWANKSWPVVKPEHAFLETNAGWYGVDGNASGVLEPWDTYDGAEQEDARSLGIVDDTCEARIEVTLDLPTNAQGPQQALGHCNVWVGPPDFSPDRRPFLSIADEINDRASTASISTRDTDLDLGQLDGWAQDLFERVYEVISVMNVDFWRNRRAVNLESAQIGTPIQGDQIGVGEEQPRAMSSVDKLRNRDFSILSATTTDRLPLSKHARTRHRALADVDALKQFIAQNPGRLKEIIRGAFTVADKESSDRTNMQMPPFMRQSNAMPLTLARWQYELLMRWVEGIENDATSSLNLHAFSISTPKQLSGSAAARREAILTRLNSNPATPNE